MSEQLEKIESLTRIYADKQDDLAAAMRSMTAALDAVKREHIQVLIPAARNARTAMAELHDAIAASPQLFNKPRTRTLNGIKVGLAKQKGTVVISDEAATIERIKRLLPAQQAELLIRKTESVDKTGVYNLEAADLKRLGISLKNVNDKVVITAIDGEVEKLVKAIMNDKDYSDE